MIPRELFEIKKLSDICRPVSHIEAPTCQTRDVLHQHRRLRRFNTPWPARICIAVLATIGGCAPDTRLDIHEFLEMQLRSREAGKSTDQGEEKEAITPPIDEYLRRYRVGPFDVLSVTLTGLDLPTSSTVIGARVDQNGEIDLPLVGGVRVADLEVHEVEDAIKSAYVPDIIRQLTVIVAMESFELTQVIVIGAATTPGLVSLRRTERNLLFAVVAASGFSSFASGRVALRRVREQEEEVSFDLTDPIQLEAALGIDPLENGDIVVVEAAQPNTIFVGGLVMAPQPQSYPPGVKMTVSQVLAAAGGPRTDVTPREATLVRRMSDGTDVHVKLDLQRIADGRDPNITLAAGDILWVPETFETKVQDFINQNLFLRAGVTVTYSVTGVEFMNRRGSQNIGGGGRTLQDQFDPFGFIGRDAGISQLLQSPPVPAQPPPR